MFAKLKKKIENEDGTRISSPRRSESVTSLTGIGATPPSLHGRDASSPPASITSEDPSMRDVSSARDDLSALLQKKSDQCRKLEGNISDLAALIKDKSKTIERLENSLKQQDEVMSKKLQEQKEEFESYRDKLIAGYQTDKLKLDQEKKQLEKELADVEAYQAKYFRKEEETDEMHGLTSQELAKVKHLLLKTETELSQCRADLEAKTHQCQTAQAQVEKLTDELGPLKQEFSVLGADSHRLKEENSERAELITKLSKDKAAFDKRLDELNLQMTEKQSQNNSLQARLADAEETHKTFIRNSDLQKNKSAKAMREKDDLIEVLNERVARLDQRVADSSLSGDEKVTALEAERKQMEMKLSEARHQLTEIKSSWSDKITHLEEQISHLNTKIAEDGEEISNHQKMTDQMRDSFEKQIEELKKELEDAEKRALEHFELAASKDSHYEKQLMANQSQLEQEMTQAKQAEKRSKSELEGLQKELSDLRDVTEKREKEAKDSISRLETQESQLQSQVKETESRLKEMEASLRQREEEVSSYRRKVEEKEASAINQDSSISTLQNQVKDLEKDVEKAVKARNDFEKHLMTSENDKGGLLEKNADLYRQMEALKSSEVECRQEHQRTLTLKTESDANMQKTEAMLRQKIQALESQIEQSEMSKAESGLYSSRIDEMSDTISTLENQLADKTRMVKKQEQMLKDLRQTLQRELKVQAIPGDDNSSHGGGDSGYNATYSSSSSPASNRRMGAGAENQHHYNHKQSDLSSSSSSLQSSSSSPSLLSSSSSNRLASSSPFSSSSSSSSNSQYHPHQNYSSNSTSSSNNNSNNSSYNNHQQHQQSRCGSCGAHNSPTTSAAVLPLDPASSSSPANSHHHTLTSTSSSVPSGAGQDSLTAYTNYIKKDLEKDVNFQYLKHVVLKFMMSREVEALQLIKAVSMLLNFTNQEQELMRETLEWKMSWFGSRPPPGRGQTSKVIPPTL